jgi:mitochondrial-processing peptidase subunit beta
MPLLFVQTIILTPPFLPPSHPYQLAHIALGFETDGWTSKMQMPLLLMQTIIGSWDKASGVGKNGTSALSRNVAENELATSYTAFNLAYKVR